MHMTKKQAERMRTVINRLDNPPAWVPTELRDQWRSWNRSIVIPDLQNMLPDTERVRLPRITPGEPHAPR